MLAVSKMLEIVFEALVNQSYGYQSRFLIIQDSDRFVAVCNFIRLYMLFS